MLKLKEKSIGLIEKVCGCSSIAVCQFCLVAVSSYCLIPALLRALNASPSSSAIIIIK